MSGRYLLDTNVAIRVLNQKVDLRSHHGRGMEAFLSLTVIGELLFGAESPVILRPTASGSFV